MKEQIEKQAIEEMAKTIANFMYEDCNDVPFSDMRAVYDSVCRANVVSCICCKIARGLTDKGYRKQEWISVEERLPEENGRYLVCVNTSHLDFENRTVLAIMRYSKSHGFYLYNETEKVTHWMAFPEAPKMKGSE